MTFTAKLEKAYRAGVAAYHQSLTPNDNPHIVGSFENLAWSRGYATEATADWWEQ